MENFVDLQLGIVIVFKFWSVLENKTINKIRHD